MPVLLPRIGIDCVYFVRPQDYPATHYYAIVASVNPQGTQVSVAWLDSTGQFFRDGPIPFLQSGQPLPGSKGFCTWSDYSPT